ncbi:MAG: hypothetical protein Q8L23_03670 [Caulobacter sp.]|nr:hypothetical protein [Caulobacter sp.]
MDNDRFIVEHNIKQFTAQLAREQDAEKRRVLSSLIAEQESKLPAAGSRAKGPDFPPPRLRMGPSVAGLDPGG